MVVTKLKPITISFLFSLLTSASMHASNLSDQDDSNNQKSFSRVSREVTSPVDLRRLKSEQGFRIDGAVASDLSGSSISKVGDINGDGIDDFITSTQSADADGRSSYGIYGKEGGYPVAIDLANLSTAVGFRIYGARVAWVSGAGDINNDGIQDIIIGAPTDAPNGNIAAGSSYVVYGRKGGYDTAIDLASLSSAIGFRINGNNGQSGYSVSQAGDVNQDKIDDILIGVPFADPAGKTNAGSVFVIYGKQGGYNTTIDLGTLASTVGVRIDGAAAGDRLGNAVSQAGDINKDGISDIIMSAPTPGLVYVIYGNPRGYPGILDLATLNATVGFKITGVSTLSLSQAGDINNDGIDDVVMGVSSASPAGKTNAGSVFVVYGKEGGYPAAIDLVNLNPQIGFRVNGAAAGDRAGWSVSSAGDFNNDGFSDFIIGAYNTFFPGKTDGGTSYEIYSGGSNYIIYGMPGGYNETIELDNFMNMKGLQVNGGFSGDLAGWSVSHAGDINNDGVDDVLIGARGAGFYYTEKNGAGATFVVYGENSINTSMPTTGGDGDNIVSAASSLQLPWYSPARWLKAVSAYWQTPKLVIDTPEAEALVKLQAKCERLIAEADSNTADKWYRYSLEDILQEMKEALDTPKLVKARTVSRFESYLKDLDRAYLKHPLLERPSFFATSSRFEGPLMQSNEVIGLFPASIPLLGSGYVLPALGN